MLFDRTDTNYYPGANPVSDGTTVSSVYIIFRSELHFPLPPLGSRRYLHNSTVRPRARARVFIRIHYINIYLCVRKINIYVQLSARDSRVHGAGCIFINSGRSPGRHNNTRARVVSTAAAAARLCRSSDESITHPRKCAHRKHCT